MKYSMSITAISISMIMSANVTETAMAQPANVGDLTKVTARIALNDLDLLSEDGQQTAIKRIKHAARNACDANGFSMRLPRAIDKACVTDLIEKAETQLDKKTLALRQDRTKLASR